MTIEKRILLVDGDAFFGLLLKQGARKLGCRLAQSRTLAQLAAVRKVERFDLVLLAEDFGPVRGVTLARFLRFFFAATPTVLVAREAGPGRLARDLPVEELLRQAAALAEEHERATYARTRTAFTRQPRRLAGHLLMAGVSLFGGKP